MAQELRLQTNHSPSIFNKDMALGLIFASLVPLPGVGFLGGLAVRAAGLLIGGFMGKRREERENREGKIVGAPTRFNKDAIIGGALGILAMPLVGLAGFGLTMISGPAAPIVGGVTLAAMAASPFVGAYMGGGHGKQIMASEFEQAVAQEIRAAAGKNRERSYAMEPELAQSNGKSFAQSLSEERARAAQRGNLLG